MSQPPDDDDVSRRSFVHHFAFFGGGAVVLGSACKSKDEAAAKPAAAPLTTSHLTFTDDEFATITAAVDRLLPTDEDAGGVEAGVPDYIDRILTTPQLAKMKGDFVPGVRALMRRADRMFKKAFAQCTAAQQDELLTIFKDSPERSGEARWYEMLMVLSLEGYLGDPTYGGNKNEAGWKTVGFSLVGRNPSGDPTKTYDGRKHLEKLVCGHGRGC
jgi:gluconate 2-dehydrogenase gamma chain